MDPLYKQLQKKKKKKKQNKAKHNSANKYPLQSGCFTVWETFWIYNPSSYIAKEMSHKNGRIIA